MQHQPCYTGCYFHVSFVHTGKFKLMMNKFNTVTNTKTPQLVQYHISVPQPTPYVHSEGCSNHCSTGNSSHRDACTSMWKPDSRDCKVATNIVTNLTHTILGTKWQFKPHCVQFWVPLFICTTNKKKSIGILVLHSKARFQFWLWL